MISHMTDRIIPIAKEWQNRPLERKYVVVFMDAVHFHVRQDKQTVKKAVYVAIGVKLDGVKEVLGMRIGGNEGFVDAIGAVFPKAEIQRCIVHQIRYTTKFVSYVVSYQHLKMLIWEEIKEFIPHRWIEQCVY